MTPTQTTKSRLELDLSLIPQEAWRSFNVINGRGAARIAERELERIPSHLRRSGTGEWHAALFLDYSMTGFGVLFEAGNINLPLLPGEKVDFRLLIQGNVLVTPCVVENLNQTGRGLRIGLRRRDSSPEPHPESSELFPAPVLKLDSNASIQAFAANPILYQEGAVAELVGLYPNRGMLFRSDDQGLLILPGMEIRLSFELPSEPGCAYVGELTWSKMVGDRIYFGVKALSISQSLSESLGSYFLAQEIGTPGEIRALGFFFRVRQENLQFEYVQSQEQYDKVLTLRRKAYTEAGKKPKDTGKLEMASNWDKESRILIAKHGDEVVASVALTFPDSKRTALRSESGFPQKRYPVHIAEKTNLIEVVNLCTDSAFRNGNLLHGMFTHIARMFLLTDRDYLVTLCTQELWPLYRKIGFTGTGHVCHFINIPHQLIYAHRSTPMVSRGLNPLVWNQLFGGMIRDLIRKDLVDFSVGSRRRIRLLSFFAPLADLWAQRKVKRQFAVMMELFKS